MLKLRRSARGVKPGHNTLLIADGLIKIIIERVEGTQVYLAIDAPRDIDIMRAEVTYASRSAQENTNETDSSA